MRLRRSPAVLATAAVTLAVVAGTGSAAPTTRVTISDPSGDTSGPLDITKAVVTRSSDGRLRAAISFDNPVRPSDLLATSGPPGSVCLRIWTASDSDPTSTPPDHFVCVTALSTDELRASVLTQPPTGGPLTRTGSASVARSGSTIVMRVSQSALGRPARLQLTVDATRAGCVRTSCVDTAPQAPATRVFRLR
jgi:hypothetical protein